MKTTLGKLPRPSLWKTTRICVSSNPVLPYICIYIGFCRNHISLYTSKQAHSYFNMSACMHLKQLIRHMYSNPHVLILDYLCMCEMCVGATLLYQSSSHNWLSLSLSSLLLFLCMSLSRRSLISFCLSGIEKYFWSLWGWFQQKPDFIWKQFFGRVLLSNRDTISLLKSLLHICHCAISLNTSVAYNENQNVEIK